MLLLYSPDQITNAGYSPLHCLKFNMQTSNYNLVLLTVLNQVMNVPRKRIPPSSLCYKLMWFWCKLVAIGVLFAHANLYLYFMCITLYKICIIIISIYLVFSMFSTFVALISLMLYTVLVRNIAHRSELTRRSPQSGFSGELDNLTKTLT